MKAGGAPAHTVRSRLLWLLAPALLVLLTVLALELAGLQQTKEWPLLVAVFHALFCAAPAIIIAVIAARDHLVSGSVSLLLFGPAALVFGLSYLVAGLLGASANLGATVHNVGMLLASALFAASAVSALLQKDLPGGVGGRRIALLLVYLGTLVLVAAIVTFALVHMMPDFYPLGRVARPREVVLSAAAFLLLAAAACFTYLHGKRQDRFLMLCGAAFALVGVSLAALVLTRAPAGSAVVWTGRTGQWIGGIYLLVAVFTLAERRILPARDVRELEERYRTLVELSPEPIIVDADGFYLFANPAAARMLGVPSPSALVGRRIDEFVAPEDLAAVAKRRSLALQGQPRSPQEIRLVRSDGTFVDVEAMDRRIMLKGRVAALVILRDITQRRQAEEALRESEERHRRLAEENEQLYRRQLEIAQSLQTALLNLPSSIGRLRLGHRYHSATETARVGGDFYDVFEIKDDQIAVMIGDVAGHGIEAARTAILVKDVVHAFTHQSPRSREVLRRTNKVLVEKEVPGFFVTVFLAILNGDTGKFQYTSAGHPATLVRRSSGRVEALASGAPPLGIYPDASWTTSEARIDPGDVLLMYTDGVIEARRDGEFFGEERLKDLLAGAAGLVEELPDYLLGQVLSFSRGVLNDDVAVLALSLSGHEALSGDEERNAVRAVGQDGDR